MLIYSPQEPKGEGTPGTSRKPLSIRAMKNFPEGKASELAGGRGACGVLPSTA